MICIIYIYIHTFIWRLFSYNRGISWDWFETKYRTGPLFLIDFSESNPSNELGRPPSLRLALGLWLGWKWLPFPTHGCDRDFKTISPQVIIKQMTGSKGHWLNHQTWLKISSSEFPNFPKRSDLFFAAFFQAVPTLKSAVEVNRTWRAHWRAHEACPDPPLRWTLGLVQWLVTGLQS